MRTLIVVGALASFALSAVASAQLPAASPAPAATPAPAARHYTTADTDIGTFLDDPAAKAVVDKYLPGFSSNDQIEMARGMTLAAIQQFSPDVITDAKLVAIDAELAKLPVK